MSALSRTGDACSISFVYEGLACLERDAGKPRLAASLFRRAIRLARSVGDRRHEGVVRGALAELHRSHGRLKEAAAEYEIALALHELVRNRRFEGIHRRGYALTLLAQGHVRTAREAWRLGDSIPCEAGDAAAVDKLVAEMRSECSRRGIVPFRAAPA
jgi:hypothetical protein